MFGSPRRAPRAAARSWTSEGAACGAAPAPLSSNALRSAVSNRSAIQLGILAPAIPADWSRSMFRPLPGAAHLLNPDHQGRVPSQRYALCRDADAEPDTRAGAGAPNCARCAAGAGHLLAWRPATEPVCARRRPGAFPRRVSPLPTLGPRPQVYDRTSGPRPSAPPHPAASSLPPHPLSNRSLTASWRARLRTSGTSARSWRRTAAACWPAAASCSAV